MEDDVIGTLPKNILKPIGLLLLILFVFAIGIQADNKNIPTRENTIERFLTANGTLDAEKIKQFRSQRINSSQSVPNLCLDSITFSYWESDLWSDSLKYYYLYDVNGNLSFSAIKYYWENDQPDPTVKRYLLNTSFDYDNNNRLIEKIEYTLHPQHDSYSIGKTTYSYNPDGSLADSLDQSWGGTKWYDDSMDSYSYDTYGNQIEYLYRVYQYNDWEWENRYREQYTYDINNNMTELIGQNWDSDMQTWYNSNRLVCSYDSHSNRLDSIPYWWEDDQWEFGDRFTFTYDHNDNQIEEIWQYDDEGTWINTWKFEYEYDSRGNQTRYYEQYWAGGDWDNSWDEVRAYDANNNITENIGKFWNWSSNKWVTYDRLLYTYDLNGNQTEYVEQLWDNNQWNDDNRRTSCYSQLTVTETGLGSDVEITLDEDISILFDSIDVSGLIDITLSENGPESDIHEFLPYDEYDYIFVTTDAEYIGEVELCFPYDNASLTDEQEDKLRVFHYTNNEWMDITTSHDKENDIICGTTVSLSPFAIGREKEPTDIDIINDAIVPEEYTLNQNYPNPFNPSTVIQFSLPRLSKVEIEVYNILGQTVCNLVNEEKPAGQYQVTWNGRDNSGKTVSSGLYFYKIKTDSFTSSKKMILLK
ncbi:MAG: T9SS type A sorting domain-containing protein [candidate division Zixibacteria bacterium]|nr:T9SS type A sorting domain-containing protein [candidate division Zixibacteria bacterium]